MSPVTERLHRVGSPDVTRQPGPNVVPLLTPERFVNDMDAVASHVVGRGLPLLITGHYRWMTRYLTSYFESAKAPQSITVGVSGPLSASVTFPSNAERGRLGPLTRSLALAQVFDRLWQLVSSLFLRLAVSAGLSIRSYVRANALASAPLIAAIVIVFFTGDSWKILGQGFDWQFFALLGFFLVFSLLGVANLRNFKSNFSVSPADRGTKMGDPSVLSLSAALASLGYELPDAPNFSKLAMINTVAVYLSIIAANLFLIGFLVSGGLILIGLIRINADLTRQLSGAPAHVILHLPGNMVITQELVSLSFTLGGLAILSFAFVTLPNQKARFDFVSTATGGLRNVLLAFMVYQAAQENEAPLTGVSSQPVGKP
jgi:hypothetical protein